MTSYTIDTDGTQTECKPANGKTFTLEELRAAIGGGYVEPIALPFKRIMLVDEEGLLKNMQQNMSASLLAHRPIVGKVLICDSKMMK